MTATYLGEGGGVGHVHRIARELMKNCAGEELRRMAPNCAAYAVFISFRENLGGAFFHIGASICGSSARM